VLQQKQEVERIVGDCGNENKKRKAKNLSAVTGSARALGLENCQEEKHEQIVCEAQAPKTDKSKECK
jgi:hypothetical protein